MRERALAALERMEQALRSRRTRKRGSARRVTSTAVLERQEVVDEIAGRRAVAHGLRGDGSVPETATNLGHPLTRWRGRMGSDRGVVIASVETYYQKG